MLFIKVMSGFAQETELKLYRLVNNSKMIIQQELTGQCWQQSQRITREDAWRCLVNEQIYDPCFVRQNGSKQQILCPHSPWVAHSIQINAEVQLDNQGYIPLDMSRTNPWAIELASGEKCQAIEANQSYDGLPIRYQCDNQTVLIGNVQRCKAEWSILQHKADGITTAAITKAWF